MIPECREVRKEILKISKSSGHGHIPTCFSIVEVLYAVYRTIKHDPKNPAWPERDIFILSKGHASLALYCVMAELGYFDKKDVETFGAFMSRFGCHADRNKLPGIEASTGSLGHGIGLAVGMALAFKIKRSERRAYTLIGDGESNEGSVWEAVMVSVNLKLNNLTIIYDNNRSHSRGLQIHDPVNHFKGFGCDVVEVDGHDIDAIRKQLVNNSPSVKVIIANTEKGSGSKTLISNQYEWHRRSPNEQEFDKLMEEVCEETI